MEPIFFVFLFLTLYPYLVYPLVVTLCSRLAGASWTRTNMTPPVSMIISVFNEERVIGEKIQNALSLDYPADRLEIIIVSDGSTDRTTQIVATITDPRVILLAFPERKGKTACLNLSVPKAKGEIIIFSDANSMFPPDAIMKIARNFSDNAIGLVTGWTKYRKQGGEEETSGLYSRLERMIKNAESSLWSCVGADGAVFAMRKELYHPLRDDDINDFVLPLKVICQRKRVVLDCEAYCIEEPAEDEKKQFRRQVRITNRTLGAIWRNRTLLNPITYRSFAFFLLSHKVLRFLVPFFFLGLLISTAVLACSSVIFGGFAAAEILFLCIGIAGILRITQGRGTQLCSFILLTIAAQVAGWMRWITGRTDIMWKPER